MENPVIKSLANSDYANSNLHGSSHGDLAHIATPKTLVTIFAALLILTGITVAVSYFGEYLGPYSLLVALIIALIKASLVALYFMHLRYDKPFNIVVFLGCLIFVTLFISFTLLDSTSYHHSIINVQSPKVPVLSPPLEPAKADAEK